MTQKHKIQLFEEKKVRTVWDDEKEEWYFSIVDVCAVLTDQPDYDTDRKYWNKLKERLVKEGNELVTNCHQLKRDQGDRNFYTQYIPSHLLKQISYVGCVRLEHNNNWDCFVIWIREVYNVHERIDDTGY